MELSDLKHFFIGEPFPSSRESHERLDKIRGLAIFASDTISSNAYATEAIMTVLIILGSGALLMTLPIALAVAGLVILVAASYVQTILHYPEGGGSYTVAKDNLGELPALMAAAALLVDYVMTVSVSTAAGVRAVTSAFPEAYPYRVIIALVAVGLIAWLNLRGVRESGAIFAIPTYGFVFGVLVMLVIGMARYFGFFNLPPLTVSAETIATDGKPGRLRLHLADPEGIFRWLYRADWDRSDQQWREGIQETRIEKCRHGHGRDGADCDRFAHRYLLPLHKAPSGPGRKRIHPFSINPRCDRNRIYLFLGADLHRGHPLHGGEHRVPGFSAPFPFPGKG